jgi:RNA polymerase sigma-70 factor, ECF subfamily
LDSLERKRRRSEGTEASNEGMFAAGSAASPLEALPHPQSLVRECVAGDFAAWRRLHRDYYQTVVAFLRRLGVGETDLDDACQEVFLQLFRSLSQFRGDSELKTWIYRLCATQASRLRRRGKVLARLSEVFHGASATPTTASSSEDTVVARALLDQALAKLTDRERLVFVLFELEGLSGAEVADIANCPINTVWRRLFDARRRLKDALSLEAP